MGGNRRETAAFWKRVTHGETWLTYDPHRVEISKQEGEEVYKK
jgi:hypothetical protein